MIKQFLLLLYLHYKERRCDGEFFTLSRERCMPSRSLGSCSLFCFHLFEVPLSAIKKASMSLWFLGKQ